MSTPTIEQIDAALDGLARDAYAATPTSNQFGNAQVKAQVLAAYGLYKAQKAALHEMKGQTTQTRNVAFGTILVGIATVIVAIVTYIHG